MQGRIFTTLVFILLSITSCTRKPQSSPETLVFAISDSPKTLDPRFSLDANGQRINALIFNGLVRIGPDLKVIGDLAKKWDYKNNVYTFFLHPNLSFSNGEAVTAEDILFTFQFYQSDKSPFKSTLTSIKNVSVDFAGPDPVVKLTVDKFAAPLLTDLTLVKILPKKIVEEKGDDFNRTLIGTGSFTFVSQSANEITLKKRDNHPLLQPKVKNVIFKIIQDDNTRFMQTVKGNIDIVQTGIPLSKIRYLEQKPDFQVYKYIGPSMNYILLNFKDNTVKNREFREALNLAINREEIIKYKLEGFGQIATSILPPNNPFYNPELKTESYDPIESGKILKKSHLEGKEILFKTSNNQETVEIAKVITAQLEKVGFKVKLQSYEWGTFYDDINKGNFQISMMRWVGITDPDIYRVAFHSEELPPQKRNRGSYINKALDRLLEQGLTISDTEKRIDHYKLIQEMVFKDLAIIPLWYNTQVSVVNTRVKNYAPAPNGDFTPAFFVEKAAE